MENIVYLNEAKEELKKARNYLQAQVRPAGYGGGLTSSAAAINRINSAINKINMYLNSLEQNDG